VSEDLQGVPPRAYTALGIAIQAYEPEATAAIIKSPAALLQVLLEAARLGAVAAAPAIRADERERIRQLATAEAERQETANFSTIDTICGATLRDFAELLGGET
jgi:hypothetical protein